MRVSRRRKYISWSVEAAYSDVSPGGVPPLGTTPRPTMTSDHIHGYNAAFSLYSLTLNFSRSISGL